MAEKQKSKSSQKVPKEEENENKGDAPENAKNFRISYKSERVVEEDEIAQISEIFNHFDFGKRGRVDTTNLPTILRLLQHNIGEDEDKELRYEVDKKNRGYFTLKELINLLARF